MSDERLLQKAIALGDALLRKMRERPLTREEANIVRAIFELIERKQRADS